MRLRTQGTSRFQFNLGARLETWPYADEDNDQQWMLFTPEGKVISFYADGQHAWEASDRSTVRSP